MTLFIMSGIPGSGKTTTAKLLQSQINCEMISSDEERIKLLRQYMKDEGIDPEGKYHFNDIPRMPQVDIDHINKILWKSIFGRLKEAMRDGRDIIMDSASCKRKYITRYKEVAKQFNQDSEVIVMHTPLDECIYRNMRRDRRVPIPVILEMAKDFYLTHGKLTLSNDYLVHAEFYDR